MAVEAANVAVQTAVETFWATYPGLGNHIPTAALAANAAYTGSPAISAVAKPSNVTFPVTNSAGATPATTLVNAGLLRAVPTNYWVNVDGSLVIKNASCGTVGTSAG